MKNILLILAIAYSSAACFAQGNLQFNQVLNFDYSVQAPLGKSVLESIMVPIGKVWKITAASTSGRFILQVNSHIICNSSTKVTNYEEAPVMNTPFWLSSGIHEFKIWNRNTIPGLCNAAISVIEFNIVP